MPIRDYVLFVGLMSACSSMSSSWNPLSWWREKPAEAVELQETAKFQTQTKKPGQVVKAAEAVQSASVPPVAAPVPTVVVTAQTEPVPTAMPAAQQAEPVPAAAKAPVIERKFLKGLQRATIPQRKRKPPTQGATIATTEQVGVEEQELKSEIGAGGIIAPKTGKLLQKTEAASLVAKYVPAEEAGIVMEAAIVTPADEQELIKNMGAFKAKTRKLPQQAGPAASAQQPAQIAPIAGPVPSVVAEGTPVLAEEAAAQSVAVVVEAGKIGKGTRPLSFLSRAKPTGKRPPTIPAKGEQVKPAATPGEEQQPVQEVRKGVSGTWGAFQSKVGGKVPAIAIAGTVGTAAALGTTAAIVASVHHTQSIALDQSVLDAPGKVYDVDLAYMVIPGITAADKHDKITIRIGGEPSIRIEDDKGKDITNKPGTDVTIEKVGDTWAVRVRRGAWCIRAVTIQERGAAGSAKVSREIPVLGNRCASHIFRLTRDGAVLDMAVTSLEKKK